MKPRSDPDRLDRRRFLAAAAAGIAGASLPMAALPALAGGPRSRSPAPGKDLTPKDRPAKAKWTPRLSASSICYEGLPVEKACERIARLGFEAVDLWSAHAGCPHLDDVAKRLGGAGLKELLARLKLRLCGFSTYQGGYRRYAELLGAAGGGVAIQGSTRPSPPEELSRRMSEFLEGLKPLAELAEKHRSWLAIENHGHALLDSLDSLEAFVDANRSKRIGVALAPYHLQARGESVEKAIEICGKQLFYFYAWQKRPGLEQLPGHGPTDFTPWLAALERIGYRRYVNPFCHGRFAPDDMDAALARSRKYLLERAGATPG